MIKDDKKFKRRCVICGKYLNKSELLRFSVDKMSSEIIVNTNSNVCGRSFYICKNDDCLRNFLKPSVLSKYTKLNHSETVVKYISTLLNSKKY